MDIWELLGIEPTNDIKAIKSAYAAMAKKYHPEENPEEFLRLKKAYQSAVRYAKMYAEASFGQEEGFLKGEQAENEKTEHFSASELYEEVKQPIITGEAETSVETEAPRETEKAEKAEKTEKPEKFFVMDFGQDAPEEDSYDYGDVGDVAARFWEELELFMFHPYLRNNKGYWKYFLDQPSYAELFWDSDFRMKFVERISREGYHNWYQNTIYFLHIYLRGFEEETGDFCATETRSWKKLLKRTKENWELITNPCSTKEEKEFYQALWTESNNKDKTAKKKMTQEITSGKYRDSRKNSEAKQQYIMHYFSYARWQHSRMEKIYRKASGVRRRSFNRSRMQEAAWMVIFLITVVTSLILICEEHKPPYQDFVQETEKVLKTEYRQDFWNMENRRESIQAETDKMQENNVLENYNDNE